MISDYKCPEFEFMTIVDEFDTEKIFFKADAAKLIFDDDESYDISNVELYVLDDININFELNRRFINEYRQFDIEFESSDGWLVNIEECYFTYFQNMYPVSAVGLKVIITKGLCNKDAPVRYYKFIENLNLTKECEINEVKCTELDNLFLIKHKDKFFKNIDGYFYTKDTYDNIKYVFDNLYYLLKYYSAESASMRISYCLGDDFQRIKICLPSKYSNFKYNSCFHDTYPNTLFDFLNTVYDSYVRIKNEDIINVKLLIHYLAFIKRESYVEVGILISAIVLEVLTKNNKKIKDSNETKFASDLKKLIKKLNLDLDKLDYFFKEQDLVCEKNTFLSEVVKARNDIVHGNAVISLKLNLLMTTFVNILALKLFNINCAMHIPLIKENVFTSKFVNQFSIDEENSENVDDSRETDDNPIKVVEMDGKLYLPLEIFNDWVNEDDEFRLLEFETKEYGEECNLDLKMARLVKQ
ncbi:hypothetical protein [Methanobrevibacter sp.]|uniref:hypothetical protein n=1 Tax=Methanobrevibacter sp. TaxID=66852 RepID=UPI00388EF792